MFAFIITTIILAAAFFSAENIVTVLVGAIVTCGLSQWVKNNTGAYGPAMVILAVIISIGVALVATIGSAFVNGATVNWNDLPQYGAQLFALATVAYKLFIADKE